MGLPNSNIISVWHEKVPTYFQCKFTIEEHLPMWYEKLPSSFHCEFTNEDYLQCGMKRCQLIFSVNSQDKIIFWQRLCRDSQIAQITLPWGPDALLGRARAAQISSKLVPCLARRGNIVT